jgi:hypothetical protein
MLTTVQKLPAIFAGTDNRNLIRKACRAQNLQQAEFAGVFAAKEEIQVLIPAGIPVRPAMRPVRPPKITSVIAEDFHGAQLARLISRIKNEFRAALCRGGGIHGSGPFPLFPSFHLMIGLEM